MFLRHPIYSIFGIAMIGFIGFTQARGWGDAQVNELKNVPKSVRNNPGAYRSHYGYYPHYATGK